MFAKNKTNRTHKKMYYARKGKLGKIESDEDKSHKKEKQQNNKTIRRTTIQNQLARKMKIL